MARFVCEWGSLMELMKWTGMFYRKSSYLGIILKCQVEIIQSQSLRGWSSTATAADVKPSTNAVPVCPAVAFSRGVIQKCQDISHGLCSFPLWIYLWGIVVIQRNVWSCEELSCWKSSLVLSQTCPYIHSQLYKRQSLTSESPTGWLCWSSFSASFFLLFGSFLESLESWLVRMFISFLGCIIQGQLLRENLISFEFSFSCLFQYFICLSCS